MFVLPIFTKLLRLLSNYKIYFQHYNLPNPTSTVSYMKVTYHIIIINTLTNLQPRSTFSYYRIALSHHHCTIVPQSLLVHNLQCFHHSCINHHHQILTYTKFRTPTTSNWKWIPKSYTIFFTKFAFNHLP